jgi:hypothetical protein
MEWFKSIHNIAEYDDFLKFSYDWYIKNSFCVF